MVPTATLAGHQTSLDSQSTREHPVFAKLELLPEEVKTPFVLTGEKPIPSTVVPPPIPPAAAASAPPIAWNPAAVWADVAQRWALHASLTPEQRVATCSREVAAWGACMGPRAKISESVWVEGFILFIVGSSSFLVLWAFYTARHFSNQEQGASSAKAALAKRMKSQISRLSQGVRNG